MKYIIGIDLGTTNSAVTYIDIDLNRERSRPVIRHFEIPQITGSGEVSSAKVLPSFLYLPGSHEFPPNALSLPWNASNEGEFVGILAREQGCQIPRTNDFLRQIMALPRKGGPPCPHPAMGCGSVC